MCDGKQQFFEEKNVNINGNGIRHSNYLVRYTEDGIC